jgi:biotin transport system substrate-specific component
MFGDLQRSTILSHTATFVALIAVGGFISIPFIPVPFTLQTLFVLLAGAVMKRYAVIPASFYLLLGAMGLPIFHNGLAGIGVLLGPTGGYMAGFLPAAALTGFAYEQKGQKIRGAALIVASAIILASGSVWLSYSAQIPLTAALLTGFIPFVIGDSLKAAATYHIAERIR